MTEYEKVTVIASYEEGRSTKSIAVWHNLIGAAKVLGDVLEGHK